MQKARDPAFCAASPTSDFCLSSAGSYDYICIANSDKIMYPLSLAVEVFAPDRRPEEENAFIVASRVGGSTPHDSEAKRGSFFSPPGGRLSCLAPGRRPLVVGGPPQVRGGGRGLAPRLASKPSSQGPLRGKRGCWSRRAGGRANRVARGGCARGDSMGLALGYDPIPKSEWQPSNQASQVGRVGSGHDDVMMMS